MPGLVMAGIAILFVGLGAIAALVGKIAWDLYTDSGDNVLLAASCCAYTVAAGLGLTALGFASLGL